MDDFLEITNAALAAGRCVCGQFCVAAVAAVEIYFIQLYGVCPLTWPG